MHNSVAYGALLASNIKTTAQTTTMVRIAYAISFLDMLGYGFLSPITYSLLNKDVIGATGFGALQSVSNAAALLAGASLGRLSDTRGRKPAIVVSAALSLLGYLLYVAGRVAADAPLAACVLPCVAQVLTTVGRAGLIAPLNALVTDGQSDEEGRRLLGRLVGTFGLGYAIGSGSGGYLSQYDHALLLALACLVSAAVLACSLLLPNSMPSSKPSSTPALAANGGGRAHAVSSDSGGGSSGGGGWLRATRTALSDRVTVLLLVLQLLRNVSFHVYSGTSKIYLCEHLGYSQAQLSYNPLTCYTTCQFGHLSLTTYYYCTHHAKLTPHPSPLHHPPLTTHLHPPPPTTHHQQAQLGYVLSFAGWSFALNTLLVVPRCLQLAAPLPLLGLAFLLTAFGRFGLAAASVWPPTPTILTSYVFLNLGQGMTITLLKSLTADAGGPQRRGLQLGLLAAAGRVGGILGPLVSGALYSHAGAASPAWASGLVALLCWCVAALFAADLRGASSRSDDADKKRA